MWLVDEANASTELAINVSFPFNSLGKKPEAQLPTTHDPLCVLWTAQAHWRRPDHSLTWHLEVTLLSDSLVIEVAAPYKCHREGHNARLCTN